MTPDMPPLPGANKGKNKTRDGRRSRSRNTTPSSVISAGTAPPVPSHTPHLGLDTSKLLVLPKHDYADILDDLEAKPSHIEPKKLQNIIEQLKKLSDHAEERVESCETAIRKIHEQMRDVEFEYKERERQAEQTRRSEAKKKDAASKNLKVKKRKDRPEPSDSIDIKNEGKRPREFRMHQNSVRTWLSPGNLSPCA